MFDIIRSIKKVTGLGKKEAPKEVIETPSTKEVVQDKISKLSGFFGAAMDQVVSEYNLVKERSKDLSTTNYNLGMKYLEEGDLKEAIFRFKITKKFWPTNYDAYYQLIICFILNDEFDEAKKVIAELSEKSPEYKEKINQMLNNPRPSTQQETSSLNQTV